MLDPELVAYPPDDKIHHVGHRAGMSVERWHRGEHNPPGLHDRHHVPQRNQSQWGFPRNQNQLSPLFEMNIRRPVDQILRYSVGNRCKRSHAAGTDCHAAGEERSTRNACVEVPEMVIAQAAKVEPSGRWAEQGQWVELGFPKLEETTHFPLEHLDCRWADREVNSATRSEKHFDKPHSVNRSTCSRERDDKIR
jgi:hypothetical protein